MNDLRDDNGPGFGQRLWRAFRNLVILTLVVGSIGAAGFALSLLNARTYQLEVRHGRLVTLKGLMLPRGFEVWQPADPGLADAYAPLELEGNTALAVSGSTYSERDELDRALFGVIEMLAKPRVHSDAPADLEKALGLVRRAELLRGLSPEQQLSLKRLKSEVAFYVARTRLDEARRGVEEAVAQLKIAAEADTRHQREANQMLTVIELPAKGLSEALRLAVHQLSAPPSPPAPPAPSSPEPPAAPLAPPSPAP